MLQSTERPIPVFFQTTPTLRMFLRVVCRGRGGRLRAQKIELVLDRSVCVECLDHEPHRLTVELRREGLSWTGESTGRRRKSEKSSVMKSFQMMNTETEKHELCARTIKIAWSWWNTTKCVDRDCSPTFGCQAESQRSRSARSSLEGSQITMWAREARRGSNWPET